MNPTSRLSEILAEAAECRERLDQLLAAAADISGESGITQEAVLDGGTTAEELMLEVAAGRWLKALAAEAVRRGYPPTYIEDTGAECWREFWSDGYSPADALDEDARAGL